MKKRDRTRAQVFDAALQLFRKQGFEKTTMRQIAEASGLATGAAYYHFSSKEAIVLELYRRNHERFGPLCEAELATARTPAQRLAAVLRASVAVVAKERKVLAPLFSQLVNPQSAISVFSKQTAAVREHSTAWLLHAIEAIGVTPTSRPIVANALWMLHLAVLLYFVNDRSPKQKKTFALIDDLVALALPLLQLAGSPLGAPLVAQLQKTLHDAGLESLMVRGDARRD